MKKLMDQKTIVENGTANSDQIARAQWIFGRTFAGDTAWISEGIRRRHYSADVIKIDGSDHYIIVSHVNDQKVLTINALAQLSAESNFEALVQSLVHLAKKFACRAIEG